MKTQHWLGVAVILAIGYILGLKFPNLYKGSLS